MGLSWNGSLQDLPQWQPQVSNLQPDGHQLLQQHRRDS